MTTTVGQFERLAAAVSERTADLLRARVLVVDEHGRVVAGSEQGAPLLHAGGRLHRPGEGEVRVPLRLDGQPGEVVIAEPPAGEPISPRLAQGLVELVISQTTIMARLPHQHDWKNKLIHDLLHGSFHDEALALREGQLLGMDLRRPRAVILIDAGDYILPHDEGDWNESHAARVHRRAQLVIASVVSFFALPSDTICAYIGDGEIAVLKASSTLDLAAWTDRADGADANPSWANLTALKRAGADLLARLRRDTGAALSIGLGRYHPGIRGLTRSYGDARAALSLGRRFQGPNRVHCLDALGIAAFIGVSDERTKVELAEHLLSPLDHERELIDTLDVFFAEHCCPSTSATRLAIHRNTLGYRLEKIASLTGLDPRRFDDAVQIRLALLLRSLHNGGV